jgi:hypothetical protein
MHHFDTLNLLDSHLGELTIFLKDSFEILNGDFGSVRGEGSLRW